jgi:NAD(P)-dependent dehydrogenase (short-subunit alcohol dehydrogenase family)
MPNQLVPGGVAVVAGGSSGIGRAAVECFAENGAAVEFFSNDEAANEELTSQLVARGFDVRGSTVNIANPDEVRNFFEEVARRRGRLSALVNSAGIQRYGTAETTSVETWDEVLDVNLRGMFLTAKHAVPLMRANGSGSIINVSSGQAIASQQNVVAYTASKGAIVAMTRAMAVDYAAENIRVNSVCPGSVDTPMLRASAFSIDPDDPERVIAEWGKGHPLGRVGQAREIADTILFLASDLSSFVTGADLRVDGGVLAGVSLVAPSDASDADDQRSVVS